MLKKITHYLLPLLIPVTLLSNSLPNREIIILLETINYETLKQTLEAPNIYRYREILHPVGIGPTSIAMLIALYQQAAPIIANRSLIKNVIDHQNLFLDFVHLDRKTLHRKYTTYNRFRGRSTLDIFKTNCQRTYQLTADVNRMIDSLMKNPKNDINTILRQISSNPSFQGRFISDIQNAMSNTSYIKSLNLEMRMFMLCSWINLEKDWYIKQVNDDIFLLIPKNYLNYLTISDTIANTTFQRPLSLTTLELKLGLKVDHMKTVDRNFFEQSTLTSSLVIPFQKSLEQIFVTTDNLKTLAPQKRPNFTWSIYMSGHGLCKHPQLEVLPQLYNLEKFYNSKLSSAQTAKTINITREKGPAHYQSDYIPKIRKLNNEIAKAEQLKNNENKLDQGMINSLAIHEFRDVLKFFNNNIQTAFLYYSSCYSAGPHLIAPYQENGKPLLLKYSVMTGTPAENMSLQEFPFINIPPYFTEQDGILFERMDSTQIDTTNKKLSLTTPLQFGNFFKLARKGIHNNDKLILIPYSLHPHVDEFKNSIPERISNIPLIRFAHSDHFETIPNDNSAVLLDANNKTKDITLNKDIGLIYNDYISGKLTLNKLENQQIPKFISMTPGFALHTFEEINSSTLNLHDVINSFLTFSDLGSSKIFWIKKLVCKNSNQSMQKNQILNDVIIMRNVFNSDTLAECSTEDPMQFKSWAYFTTDNYKETKLTWDGPLLENNNFKLKPCNKSEHKEECLNCFPQAITYINPILQNI